MNSVYREMIVCKENRHLIGNARKSLMAQLVKCAVTVLLHFIIHIRYLIDHGRSLCIPIKTLFHTATTIQVWHLCHLYISLFIIAHITYISFNSFASLAKLLSLIFYCLYYLYKRKYVIVPSEYLFLLWIKNKIVGCTIVS